MSAHEFDGSCPNKLGPYTKIIEGLEIRGHEKDDFLRRPDLKLADDPEDKKEMEGVLHHCMNHPGYTVAVIGISADGLPDDHAATCTTLAVRGPGGQFNNTSLIGFIETIGKSLIRDRLHQNDGNVVKTIMEFKDLMDEVCGRIAMEVEPSQNRGHFLRTMLEGMLKSGALGGEAQAAGEMLAKKDPKPEVKIDFSDPALKHIKPGQPFQDLHPNPEKEV